MAFVVIMQFVLQTAMIVMIGIMWQPVLTAAGYDTELYTGASLQEIAIRDALWYFGIIIPIIAQVGNILWFYVELRKQTVEAQGY